MMKTDVLKCGIQPFWFWNGDMKKEEILRQIHEMKEQGITGFIIHSRQGMELPYLSETYFERMELALEEAKHLDMEVWLYDEYPYPSGVTAGQVTLNHPEYQCKMLEKTEYRAAGGEEVSLTFSWGRVLSAMAYPVKAGKVMWQEGVDISAYAGTAYTEEVFQFSGLTKYNHKRFFTGKQARRLMWTAPEGEWQIYLFTEVIMTGFKYFDTFIDTLNPEAVKCFLETTHERYRKRFGTYLGTTIKGVFTDEITAFPPERPWSPLLPDMIQKKTGINILEYLPVLFDIPMDDKTEQVLYAYWNTCEEAFVDSYDRQIYNWCEETGVRYIGEKPIMRSGELQFVHVTGIDTGHQKVGEVPNLTPGRYRTSGKLASSAAHLYKRDGALCEAFHSIGWGMTLQDMKWTFDWLTVTGIDWFVIHAFYYTTNGLRKHDAPPSAFYQMPWWKDMKELSSYALKLNHMNRSLKRCVPVLLVDPITSVWTVWDKERQGVRDDFGALQEELFANRVDYYIIDPHLLAEAQVVEENGNVSICVGGEAFSCILLPSITTLEDDCFAKVREFTEKGGFTAAVGNLANRQIETENPGEWMGHWFDGTKENTLYAKEPKALGRLLKERLGGYGFSAKEGEEVSRAVLSVEYEMEDGKKAYFIMNSGQKKASLTGNVIEGELILKPLESGFYEAGENGKIAASLNKLGEQELSLEGEWQMKLESSNALRLGWWDLEARGTGQKSRQPVEPMALIDQLEKAEMMIPVNPRKQFGCPKTLLLTDDTYCYTMEFGLEERDTAVYLVSEKDGILGDYEIVLNGEALPADALQPKAFFMHDNVAADVSAYLKSGINTIQVYVNAKRSFDGLVSPLYLMGDFGVKMSEGRWWIVKLPQTAPIKSRKEALIPFYGGTVSYTRKLQKMAGENDGEAVTIRDIWMQDDAELFINGVSLGAKAWAPYTWEVPKGLLKEKDNTVTLKLTTAMDGLFEGQYFDREAMTYVNYQGNETEIEEYEAVVHK